MTQSKLHFTVLFKYFAAFVLGCALVLGSTLGLCGQTKALAANDTVYAYSVSEEDGTETYYHSVSDALNAGYSGKTIHMNCNWLFAKTLEIADSKTITIDMNGYGVYGSGSNPVIEVNENKVNINFKRNKNF